MGWLDAEHPFPRGVVAPALVERLRVLAASPVELTRGFHACELCSDPTARGNGEIRVCHGGITYSAPVLVLHYVERHSYAPPAQFLNALQEPSPA